MQNQKVLVIGGGIAGMISALEAAAHGFDVYLIEKTARLGGHAYEYCCKATAQCNKCSACLVPQAKIQVENNPQIAVFLNTVLTKADRNDAGFEAVIKTMGNSQQVIKIKCVIVATGFLPFNAAVKGEFGYARNRNVITALELENAIRAKGSLTSALGKARNIGFIQCVGSRDLQLGNNYCSKVCCMYAAKLAKLIRSELPEAEISIFYMDLQTFGTGFDGFMEACKKDDKIQFIRGIPAKIFGFPYKRLTVRYANSLTGELCEDFYDLIILSTAITPGKEGQDLAGILGIELDQFGFFKTSALNPIITNVPGIYLAGTCQSPKDIPQTIEQAKAAVSAALT